MNQPQKSSNTTMYIMLGCGGVLLLSVITCAVGAWWALSNVKNIGADLVNQVAIQGINESTLTDEQKQGMIAHIDGLTQDFKDGEITIEDFELIAAELAESPLIYVGTVLFVEAQYIQPSGLTDDEKGDATLNLQRFARGVYEQSIPQSTVDSVIAPLEMIMPDGTTEMKDPSQVTDEELRQFLANVKNEADAAGVANEPFDVDIVKEFGDAINRALGRGTGGMPSPGE